MFATISTGNMQGMVRDAISLTNTHVHSGNGVPRVHLVVVFIDKIDATVSSRRMSIKTLELMIMLA